MGFTIDFSVLNQKGTPALYSDIFANRPAAGYQGRLFIATDTAAIYEDTGTAWTLIANVSSGAGTLQQVTTNGNTSNVGISVTAGGINTNSATITSLTTGSVPFAGAGGVISQDNANLFWDDTNNRLGINTNTPGNSLDVHAAGTNPILALNNTAGNQSALSFLNTSVAKWRIGNTATNTLDIYNFTLAAIALQIKANNDAVFISNVQGDNFVVQPTGYSTLAALSRNLTGAGYGVLSLRNSAVGTIQPSSLTVDRTYTLPDATGTIALTSNLSSYLPLTGGTLTGALIGTTANFSSDITIGGNDSVSTRLYVRTENNANNPALVAFKNITSISTEDVFRVQSWNGALNTVASIQADGSSTFSGDLSLTRGTTRNLNFYNNTAVNINAQIQYSEVNANTGQLLFKTNNAGTLSTKLTISNTGSVNVVPNLGANAFAATVSGSAIAYLTSLASTSDFSGYWQVAGNLAGTITHPTNTTTNYNVTSDYRLKENIAPLEGGIKAILKLKPLTGNYKADPNKTNMPMFIAHEVQEVVPIAVTGQKDAFKINKETGIEEMDIQQLDAAKLIPHIVKAIQEQQTIIDSLLKKIELLENK